MQRLCHVISTDLFPNFIPLCFSLTMWVYSPHTFPKEKVLMSHSVSFIPYSPDSSIGIN